MRAFAVPFLLPKPQCLPLRRASVFLRTLAREWTATGFLMIKPSFINLRIFCPGKRPINSNHLKLHKNSLEFVLAISVISLGSNQTFFLPHRITEAASLFCSFNELQQLFKLLKGTLIVNEFRLGFKNL